MSTSAWVVPNSSIRSGLGNVCAALSMAYSLPSGAAEVGR